MSKTEDNGDVLRPVVWVGDLDGYVDLIDQTKLPGTLERIACHDVETIRDAICRLAVRGAPAIGIAAAMGVVLGVRSCTATDRSEFLGVVDVVCADLASTRPTAKNLFGALDRMTACANAPHADVDATKHALLAEAVAIRDEDAAMCRAIGEAGQSLIREGGSVLTHCNAGALATAEYGTALAVMYAAHARGRKFTVYAGETRPLLQGSRLTAWELRRANIDVTVICDNMAAHVMKLGLVDLVITGADRIAANGDAANKVGTYGLAVLAKAHNIPFYVAAPSTTFDLSIEHGDEIPIEERASEEISDGFGVPTAPEGVGFFCPAFDVTPAELIRGLITERGIIDPADCGLIAEALS